jgi:predicted transcriptional regulator
MARFAREAAKEAVLELDVRRRVYETLLMSPGLHFREIQRRMGMAYGALQYHLEYLVRHGLIVQESGSEYSRFFPSEFKSIREREIMSLLRQESIRGILLNVLAHPGARNKDLADALGLSASTISWHLGRLVLAGALAMERAGGDASFKVVEPEVVTRLLVTYKSSFLDRIVDRFVEVWENEKMRPIGHPLTAEPAGL